MLLGLLGCATNAQLESPTGRVMLIGGEGYIVEQLTAGTWTAMRKNGQRVPSSVTGKAALLGAIEEASGCKVTDSDYSQAGKQLDAQVRCPGHAN